MESSIICAMSHECSKSKEAFWSPKTNSYEHELQ